MSGTNKPDFSDNLSAHRLELLKDRFTTLQVNVGLFCNQTCRHCHLDAGPDRTREIMGRETVEQVVALAASNSFQTIDITGGAPELQPLIGDIITRLRPFCATLSMRSNLTALLQKSDALMPLLKDNAVTIIASFPSLNELQAESLRGRGVFKKSVEALKMLNAAGYGSPDTHLELNLVVNPSGAFLPPAQAGVEKRYRKVLQDRWEIFFNKLFVFANVPLGRFRDWLVETGNLEAYMDKLAGSFNPCTVEGLMCRGILSVSWDGYLYDCDFNQAVGLYMRGKKKHISELRQLPVSGFPVTLGNHCYTCTAGGGFT